MRKLIFQQWVSMDGYAADKKGEVRFIESETDHKYSDDEQLKWLETIDTILLGRKTYDLFIEYWPTATTDQEVIADKLNTIPKIVFSKTLDKAPWGKWPEATVKSDAVQAVKELKAKQGKDIVLWGSISLSQELLKANLIDEIHMRMVPKVVGGGRLMFESSGPLDFDLYETKQEGKVWSLLKYRLKAG